MGEKIGNALLGDVHTEADILLRRGLSARPEGCLSSPGLSVSELEIRHLRPSDSLELAGTAHMPHSDHFQICLS